MVTPTTISNCFRKAGFILPSVSNPEENPHSNNELVRDAEEDSEHGVSLERLNLESSCSFEEYVMCDRNVQCSLMPNNEDIIASIASTERDEENDIDDHGDELPNITY